MAVFTMCISTSFWSRRRKESSYDSITSFYRGSGLEVVETLCRDDPEGVLVLWKSSSFP
ncbi:MAG: hypothetical protein ACLRMZ_11045 [Blautia marasmi]